MKIICKLAKLVKVQHNKMTLTNKAIKIMNKPELVNLIFETAYYGYNWGYFDGYRSERIGFSGSNFTLYLLKKYGKEWRDDIFYAEKYFKAFPDFELDDGLERSASCFSLRSFTRMLSFFNFVDVEGEKFSIKKVRTTDLFDKYIDINMTELHEKTTKKEENVHCFSADKMALMKKPGVNEPCQCGSNKKYKKCCKKIDESIDSYLKQDELEIFHHCFFGLLTYINVKKNILKRYVPMVSHDFCNYHEIHIIRDHLLLNTKIITEYIKDAIQNEEFQFILKSWKKYYHSKQYYVMEHRIDGTLMLSIEDSKLYLVKGLGVPLKYIIKKELPTPIEAVLLPFKDKIVYDTMVVIESSPIPPNIMEIHKKALDKGIITRFYDNNK